MGATGQSGADGHEAASSAADAWDEEDLNPYEQERQATIAKNKALMMELGILKYVNNLETLSQPAAAQRAKRPAKPAKRKQQQAAEPTRKSARVRGQHAAPLDAQDSEEAELAMFKIDGACPRCGKVVTRGHVQHLATCTGPAPTDEDKHAEEEEQEEEAGAAATRVARDAAKLRGKLRELELGGLFESTEDGASFVVIGSTGSHYTVRLSDAKRSCTCPDHRIRHRDCKHIKLILQQLGISQAPERWHQAIEDALKQRVDGAAGGGAAPALKTIAKPESKRSRAGKAVAGGGRKDVAGGAEAKAAPYAVDSGGSGHSRGGAATVHSKGGAATGSRPSRRRLPGSLRAG